ncbi:MAG: glycosyltransferase family 4 protein [Fimbriimonadales bacterium]|nr:glycosyltransferase family 4 protein [Fimbriimonadales bacterium]
MIVEVATSLRDWGSIERYVLWLTQGMPRFGWNTVLLAAPGSPLIHRAGGLGRPLRFGGKYDWSAFPRLVRTFRRLQPDVVHLHFSPDYLVPAIAAKVARSRVMATRHLGLPYSRRKVRLLAKRIDLWVGVSRFVSETLVRSGFPPGTVRTIHSGVPGLQPTMTAEQARARFGVTPGCLAVGYFGRLEPEKGIEGALAACAGVRGLEWHVFGGGSLESRLRDACNGRSVLFHGKVESVADAMAAVDVVAIPSWWDEAFPFAALEAMSLGLPIVASNVGGLPEAVDEGVTGFLVPKEDPKALRSALEELSAHPERRRSLGEAARRRYRELFTLEAMLERYDRLLRDWIGG